MAHNARTFQANRGSTNPALLITLIVVLLLVFAILAWYQFSAPESGDQISLSNPPIDDQSQAVEPSGRSVTNEPSGAEPTLLPVETEPMAPTVAETEWPDDGANDRLPSSLQPALDAEQADVELHAGIVQSLRSELTRQIVQPRLIERLVVTINSLDRDGVPLRMRPMAHVPGLPAVANHEQGWRLSDKPDPRYDPYRALLEQLDPEQTVDLYRRFEPAFEQAWLALGQTESRFDQRLIEVIDHLLAFDYPDSQPELIRPEVLYEFADPALEQATAGHKLLLRIGPGHSRALQQKLRQIRSRLMADSTAAESSAGA